MKGRDRLVVSVVAALLLHADVGLGQPDLNGHWRTDTEFFDISQTGNSVTFTYFGIVFSGTVSSDGHLVAPTVEPLCAPGGKVDARFAGEHLDGVLICGGVPPPGTITRFFAQRCECVDGNSTDGDGCDAECQIEPCYSCTGDPSVCTPLGDAAPCSDGNACTSGETCTAGVCGGGSSPVTPCTNLTGRWLLRYTDSLLSSFTTVADVVQIDNTLRMNSYFGTIRPFLGTFDLSQPSLELFCNFYGNLFQPLTGAASQDGGTWIGFGSFFFGTPTQCFGDDFSVTGTRCGGGTLDPGEECDDGNIADGDGCSSICRTEIAAAAAENLKCYQVKDLASPSFTERTVDLADEFVVNDGTFEVLKPYLFCMPVSADGAPIVNSDAYLTCYKTKGPKLTSSARPRFAIDNPFGPLQLEAKKPRLVCMRSTKTPLP